MVGTYVYEQKQTDAEYTQSTRRVHTTTCTTRYDMIVLFYFGPVASISIIIISVCGGAENIKRVFYLGMFGVNRYNIVVAIIIMHVMSFCVRIFRVLLPSLS